MARKTRPARTVAELCVARGGAWKGTKTMTFIAQWTMASQAIGGPITMPEYIDWWRESRSTAYRHLQQFRELFPNLETPQPIADLAIARAQEWQSKGVKGIGSLPAGVALA